MPVDPIAAIEAELSAVHPDRDIMLTIGVFDGVHLGHQALINELKKRAGESGFLTGLVTFRSHPRLVVHPGSNVLCLTTVEDRIAKLKGLGLDVVVALPFTLETARLSARDFVALLTKHLRMRGLLIGPDFALGNKREGNAAHLKALGREFGFNVDVIRAVRTDDEIISSTLLRHTLGHGDMKKAARLLGHPFYLRAPIVHGTEHGRDMGFPTANQDIPADQALPANGVYVTVTRLNGQSYPSVTNIGIRPTFGRNPRTVETFIIGFAGDIYGKTITVDFMDRLRGETRFNSPAELKAQIVKDVARTRDILGSDVIPQAGPAESSGVEVKASRQNGGLT